MRSHVGALVLVVAAGCGGNDGNQLVRVEPVAAGADCTHGGLVVQTGNDDDHDQELDDDEITSSSFVCNGADEIACNGAATHTGTVTISSAQDFAILDGIACLDGDLIVTSTDVDEIHSLDSLTTVTGAVIVASNPNLVSLDGLGALREVGLSYLVQGNPSLVELGALANLTRASSVVLAGNDSLQDLAGLASLTELSFDLTVVNNRDLMSLHGLENVSTSQRGLRIRSNPRLTDLAAIEHLSSLPLLEINGNVGLTAVDLPNLSRLDVRILIDNNPVLQTVRFGSLVTLGDGLYASTNPALETIELPSLVAMNNLKVAGAASLTSIAAPRLTFLAGNAEITNAPLLATTNFESLSQIGGYLLLQNLETLRDLDGFGMLSTVHNTLYVINTGVVDFQGLGALQQVAGDLKITTNPNLSGFTGLTNMTEVGGNLTITGNTSLPLATAQSFAAQLLIGGTTTIN